MTNEEALRLAKLAWPNQDGLQVILQKHSRSWIWSGVYFGDGSMTLTLLKHPDRARFEAALRVLAGEPSTADKKLNAICRVLAGEP